MLSLSFQVSSNSFQQKQNCVEPTIIKSLTSFSLVDPWPLSSPIFLLLSPLAPYLDKPIQKILWHERKFKPHKSCPNPQPQWNQATRPLGLSHSGRSHTWVTNPILSLWCTCVIIHLNIWAKSEWEVDPPATGPPQYNRCCKPDHLAITTACGDSSFSCIWFAYQIICPWQACALSCYVSTCLNFELCCCPLASLHLELSYTLLNLQSPTKLHFFTSTSPSLCCCRHYLLGGQNWL